MKLFIITFIGLTLSNSLLSSDGHQHHDQKSKSLELVLNNGKKWNSDAPLRRGMNKIHKLVKENLVKIENEKMEDQDFSNLANKVQANLDSIFKNCKLEPEADAQLHIILSQIMKAKMNLSKNNSPKKKAKAVHQIISAYESYLKYFEHE